jgi:TetR/AcrR family transcriptional regulator
MNQTNGTERRLLDAALRLFAQRGYNGTSIRTITRAAGANLGAVTYHYGGKRGLYARALQACIGPLAERVEAACAETSPPLSRLERVVEVFFDYLRERPELPQLMLQETVAGRLPPPEALASLHRILGALAAVMAEGQAEGTVGAGDPRLQAISLVSQPLHLSIGVRLLEAPELQGQVARGVLLEHARSFVRRGLAPREPGLEGVNP